jgi:hypothetical protein
LQCIIEWSDHAAGIDDYDFQAITVILTNTHLAFAFRIAIIIFCTGVIIVRPVLIGKTMRIESQGVHGTGMHKAFDAVFKAGFGHIDRTVDINFALACEILFPKRRVPGHVKNDITSLRRLIHISCIGYITEHDLHRQGLEILRLRPGQSEGTHVPPIPDQFMH